MTKNMLQTHKDSTVMSTINGAAKKGVLGYRYE